MSTLASRIATAALTNSETCPLPLGPAHPATPPLPFPIAAFPDFLRAYPAALAAAAPVSLEFAATTCLGVLSTAIGESCFFRDGERLIRPNLFLLGVAPDDLASATALRLACEPLVRHQSRLDPLNDPFVFQPQFEDTDSFEDDDETRSTRRGRRSERKPAALYFHQSVPRGHLFATIAGRPAHSLALLNPHADSDAQILRAPNSDHPTYLAAHSGNGLSSPDRQGSQILRTLINPCLSLSWTITPESWNQLLSAPNLPKSTLLPRFLFAFPSSERCPQACGIAVPPMSASNLAESLPVSPTSEIPDALPIIPESLKDDWSQTICHLLRPDFEERRNDSRPSKGSVGSRGHFPMEFPVTPEARRVLRAYENEVRRALSASTDPLQRTFLVHHPDTAWRLALLLHLATIAGCEGHSTGEAALTPETAADAITITRWFAHQHENLVAHFHHLADLRLLQKVTRALERAGGSMTLGQLRDRQNLSDLEARRLAAHFPHLLVVTEQRPRADAGLPSQGGRKSEILALVHYDHHHVPHDETADPAPRPCLVPQEPALPPPGCAFPLAIDAPEPRSQASVQPAADAQPMPPFLGKSDKSDHPQTRSAIR